jgi:hypothetical protein
MVQTAAHVLDHVIPHVPARHWGAVAADSAAPAAGCATKAGDACAAGRASRITRLLLKQAGGKAREADSGVVTLFQHFGSAANLNIHLSCLVLDGVYRRDSDGQERVDGAKARCPGRRNSIRTCAPTSTDSARTLQCDVTLIIARRCKRPERSSPIERPGALGCGELLRPGPLTGRSVLMIRAHLWTTSMTCISGSALDRQRASAHSNVGRIWPAQCPSAPVSVPAASVAKKERLILLCTPSARRSLPNLMVDIVKLRGL